MNQSRRHFIGSAASAALALGVFPHVRAADKTSRRNRVAILITEVRKMSHGQHFLDRMLGGYGWAGQHHYPDVDIAGIYVDQFPEKDLARERERRFEVPIYPSIEETLALGGSGLKVDGVVIIAEHGKYPRNEKGQTLYPRYSFFKKTTDVFAAAGRSVPIFNDKHLSTDWKECVEMVELSRRLDFPFLAGSSLPVTWRMPSIDLPFNSRLAASVCVCYGGVDSYDFHGLETAQCMSERRAGGESGIKSVHALRGGALWARLESDDAILRLFLAALARSETRRAPPGYTTAPATLALAKKMAGDPIGYFFEHTDGLRTAMFLMNGLVSDFTYAGLHRATGKITSCIMYLPMPSAQATTANFFNPLIHHIERTVIRNRAPYPVERTLLTSGMTLFGVESLFQGQKLLATPELAVPYRTNADSHFWRA